MTYPMVTTELHAHQWAALFTKYGELPPHIVGVSVTLAARLLHVSRSRVHQLLNAGKLRAVDVYDENRTRIGHMVTLASIANRRRTVRPRRTQWQPAAR